MDVIKTLKKVYLAFFGMIGFILILVVIGMGNSSPTDDFEISTNLNAEVEKWRSLVSEKAEDYQMTDYVDLILCVMQVESNGQGSDPMQAAEGPYNKRYPKVPNGIQDPVYSIECGIQELKSVLTKAGVKNSEDIEKIKVALAGYNFGSGFIDWVNIRGGKWTIDLAEEFSRQMATQMGWAVYGDPNYVNKVMDLYLNNDFLEGSGDFIPPLKEYTITSQYGYRSALNDYHYGVDLDAGYGATIYSPTDATVEKASSTCPGNGGFLGNQCPFKDFYGAGNYVLLKQEQKKQTIYIMMCHMDTVNVQTGQKVKKGQKIGNQGHSGNSTGSHLHLEFRTNKLMGYMDGTLDPNKYIDFK